MKIYPYLSYHREINETDVNNCNLQKVWDNSESLNGNSCSLSVFLIRSTIPMISADFNIMECDHLEKGEGKRTILRYCISYFRIEVFLKEVLGLLPYEGTAFIPNLSSYSETVCKFHCRTEIIHFSRFFFVCFVNKIFAITIRNIIPYTDRTFQSRMLTSLRKCSSVSSFSIACSRFT